MNMKNIYTVKYNKPVSRYITKYQNQVRNITLRIVKGEDEARNFINEVINRGYAVISVYNGIGEKVIL